MNKHILLILNKYFSLFALMCTYSLAAFSQSTASDGTQQNGVPSVTSGVTSGVTEDALSMYDPEMQLFETNISNRVRNLISADIERYCMEYCSLLGIQTEADDLLDANNPELGFENSEAKAGVRRKFRVKNVTVSILNDSRYGVENLRNLQNLLDRLKQKYPYPIRFEWIPVIFPDSTAAKKSEASVRQDFINQISLKIERIIAEFCPKECKINEIDVKLNKASVDDVMQGNMSRFMYSQDGKGALQLAGVKANISINDEMSQSRQNRIRNLIEDILQVYGSVNLELRPTKYPSPASEIQKDLDESRKDPYNLEKFAALMKLFKENMVGKEVYKEVRESLESSENTESKESIENRETNAEKTLRSETNSTDKTSSSSSENSKELNNQMEKERSTMYLSLYIGAGLLLVILIGVAIWMRSSINQVKLQSAISESMQSPRYNSAANSNRPRYIDDNKDPTAPKENYAGAGGATWQLQLKMELQRLKDEIIQTFIEKPKVARDVVSRILREEGTEVTAKYISIFGEMIIFELLNDTELKQDLNALAEYVHLHVPEVSDKDQTDLLKKLKLKFTAGSVKQMANKTMDAFDFLKAWSVSQIFNLIKDEPIRIQSIVLTQISQDKRRGVFDLYIGIGKSELLRELSSMDAAPRDYLYNTASFLKQKASAKNEFDTENIRGLDVLFDLIGRSHLEDQKRLLAELDNANPEGANVVRQTLVTPETVAFLPTNVLLDLFINLDSKDLTSYLAGVKESIRNAILTKVPREIAFNWAELIQGVRGVNSETFKLAEMKVINKIKLAANNGEINLGEINSRMFGRYQTQASNSRVVGGNTFPHSPPNTKNTVKLRPM